LTMSRRTGSWGEQRQQAWNRLVTSAQKHRRAYGMLLAFLFVAVVVNVAVFLLHVGEGLWWLAFRNAIVLLVALWMTRRVVAIVRGDPAPPRYWQGRH